MTATGNWNLVVKTPFGEQKLRAELLQEGEMLTGTMDDASNPVGPIQNATINGNLLVWKFPVKKPFAATLGFSMTLEGDTLTGTCKAGVFPLAKASGTRA